MRKYVFQGFGIRGEAFCILKPTEHESCSALLHITIKIVGTKGQKETVLSGSSLFAIPLVSCLGISPLYNLFVCNL